MGHYNPPLLFNVELDPSEAVPLNPDGKVPTEEEAQRALERIGHALAAEKATFVPGRLVPEPDQEGEGPGRYGICCDRSKNCDCNGSPSFANVAPGILGFGTRAHHDAYHAATGHEPP